MLPSGVSNWIRNSAPPAIAGSGGHNSTYSVACSLWRMLGEESAVWDGLREYNSVKCTPAWSEKELRHKLTHAEKATRGERAGQLKYGPRNPATMAQMRRALASFPVLLSESNPVETPPVAIPHDPAS